MRRLTTLSILMASALTLAACGSGGGGGNPITVVSGGITYFVVRAPGNRDTVQVVPGGQSQLSGAAYDANLNPLALIGDTTWTSRNPSVATVDIHGLVTTSDTGSVWVLGSFTPKNSQTAYSDSVLIQVLGQN